MGLAIVLRNQLPINRFRDLLVGSINLGVGNKVLLCSGFFQENRGKIPPIYQASQENNLAQVVHSSGVEFLTVGVYNRLWMPSYKEFRKNMLAAGGNVKCFYKSGMKWHAKIFVLSKNDVPVFGIIGSSNMTRPAFGSIKDFNYECDVILWPASNEKISKWVNEKLESDNFPYEVIRAPYIVKQNNGLTVQNRLKNIRDEVLNSNLTILQ